MGDGPNDETNAREREVGSENTPGIPWWATLFLPSLAFTALLILSSLLLMVHPDVSLDAATSGGLQAISFLAVIVVGRALFLPEQPFLSALQVRPVDVTMIGFCIAAGAALQFPMSEISNLISESFPIPLERQLERHQLIYPSDAASSIGVLIALVVVAPVTEELLFRGLLLPGTAKRYGAAFAVGITSIAFGIIHLEPHTIPSATLGGVILGWVALRTRSTLAPIALHASINAVPLLLNPSFAPIRGFNVMSERALHIPPPLLVGSTAVALVALFFVGWLTRRQ